MSASGFGKRSLVPLSKVAFSRKTFMDRHQLITILSVLLRILGENVYLRIRPFVLLRQLPLGSLCTGRTLSREGVLRFSGRMAQEPLFLCIVSAAALRDLYVVFLL